jgi:hypothetical protein
MVPQELRDILGGRDDDDFDFYIRKVAHHGEKFVIDLHLQYVNDHNETVYQTWTIEAFGHRTNRISFEFIPFIDIQEEHPLLWEFTDIQCQLYFSGTCQNPSKLFYDLYHSHKATFKRYSCFNMQFTDENGQYDRFKYSSGLFAKGSKKLMQLYAGCLRENGLDFTIIGERPPTYWEEDGFVPKRKDLKVLFLGDTYIIATAFFFQRKE